MLKKLIFIFALALGGLILAPASAHACDYVCPEDQGTCENPCPDNAVINAETTSETNANPITGAIDEPSGDTAEPASSETSAATEAETTNTEAATEETDPETPTEKNPIIAFIEDFAQEKFGFTLDAETWPLVISAAALILTVLLIIIINLAARKKARRIDAQSNRQELENGLRDL